MCCLPSGQALSPGMEPNPAGACLAQCTGELGDPEGCVGALGEASSDGIPG